MSEFNPKRIQAEISSMKAMGMTEKLIAEKLNAQGLKTGGGNEWTPARLTSFKVCHRNKLRVSAKPALKIPKITKKPAAKGLADDLAISALKRTDWSDRKKLAVVSAILAD